MLDSCKKRRQFWKRPLKKSNHNFKVGDRVKELMRNHTGTVSEIKTYHGLSDKLFVILDSGYEILGATEFFKKVK
jgi:hypothetical protein